VVGSVNLDQSFEVRTLPRPGETVLASSVTFAPGGKGGNQAVAAARAGADVTIVAAVGDDAAASRLRAHLRTNEVGLGAVITVPGPSGAAVILVDDDAENCIVVAPGANAHLHLASAHVRAEIADADVVLIQLEIPIDTALAAARTGRAGGAVVVLNASPSGTPRAQLEELASTADVVIVNDHESRESHGSVPLLVITRGARGATYEGSGERYDVKAPAVEAIDTTGAGDVFAGVLAADWHLGPRTALIRACAAGALATLTPGAGDCAPTREAIDDVLE
jgi:ribokinase